MHYAKLDDVVVAADKDAVIARARDFQAAKVPEVAIELDAPIARRE